MAGTRAPVPEDVEVPLAKAEVKRGGADVTVVAVGFAVAAPTGLASVTTKVSSGSGSKSPTRGTEIDLLVCPARNVTVPETAAKSLPA